MRRWVCHRAFSITLYQSQKFPLLLTTACYSYNQVKDTISTPVLISHVPSILLEHERLEVDYFPNPTWYALLFQSIMNCHRPLKLASNREAEARSDANAILPSDDDDDDEEEDVLIIPSSNNTPH